MLAATMRLSGVTASEVAAPWTSLVLLDSCRPTATAVAIAR